MILETERLRLERFTLDDAGFILRLLNEPSFILHVADKHVRSLDDARAYLSSGPVAHYQRHGFGLWRVCERASGAPVGMCGLIQRDTLDDVDLGYSLLPEFSGKGYALEAARAVMRYAKDTVGLDRLVAVVGLANERSIRLLGKLGFTFERTVRLPPDEEEIGLYALSLAAGAMREGDTTGKEHS